MSKSMVADLRSSLIAVALFTLLCGLAYPLFVTGVAQVAFPGKANGSLLQQDGRTVGSALIGQNFELPQYFHARPSAAAYDGAASAASNLGPTSQTLVDRVGQAVAAVRAENGLAEDASVPADAVTTSASGLDPDISPAYAELQVARVAEARGMSDASVRALVQRYTSQPPLGVLGAASVNVLELNLALDEWSP